nr:SDR family NAD(P)-dependent oxidoreductase [Micrococcus terreus]MDK7702137.1 SDR family NAD(P)-dependent oxidoreductase [Micrococcus terreus]
MRVLVTGGAGYIGSHTCLRLLEEGHEVAVLDNFENSHPQSLRRVEHIAGRETTVHEGDVRDPASFTPFMHQWAPEAVIHSAGLKSVGGQAPGGGVTV